MILKNKNNSPKEIVLNSNTQEFPLNLKSLDYLKKKRRINTIKTDGEFDISPNKIKFENKSISNFDKYRLKIDSAKNLSPKQKGNNMNKNMYLNQRKNSRNFSINRLIKKNHSLSNFILTKNLNFSIDKNNNNFNYIVLNNNK